MKFLSKQALFGLQSYKYKSGGYTYLDTLHNPFWNCEFCKRLACIIVHLSFLVAAKQTFTPFPRASNHLVTTRPSRVPTNMASTQPHHSSWGPWYP
eukprot:991489-Pelagomonas_calceolata.AAC.7